MRVSAETLVFRVQTAQTQFDSARIIQDTVVRTNTLDGLAEILERRRVGNFRSLRHFGPFREGSDLTEIQVQVHDGSATWYFNQFFASFTTTEVAESEPIYRIYYRADFLNDAPASAVLPNNATPSLSHTPDGPAYASNAQIAAYGEANRMLLELQSVFYSSRYGGSVVLDFGEAPVPGPNQPTPVPDDFEYEIIRRVGNDEFRFDLEGVRMRVYVTPVASQFNPRSRAVQFRTPTRAELDYATVVAYRNGLAVETASVLPMLRESLDSIGSSVARSIGAGRLGTEGVVYPPANRFAHAFVHDQFQTLFGTFAENDKVTNIQISDGWLDLTTEQYQPYLFTRFDILEITDATEGSIWEGDKEWRLQVTVLHSIGSSPPQRVSRRTYDLANGFPRFSLGGFTLAECATISEITVRFRMWEVDPFNPDDELNSTSEEFGLDCGTATPVIAQLPGTGWARRGIVPHVDGTVPNCGTSGSFGPDAISPDRLCFDDSGVLLGTSGLGTPAEPSSSSNPFPLPGPGARIFWRARLGVSAR